MTDVEIRVLRRRARDLLADASLLSDQPARRLDTDKTSRAKASSRPPAGETGSLYDAMLIRFYGPRGETGCVSLRDWTQAVDWAAQELASAKRRTATTPTIPFKQQILIDWEGYRLVEVERQTRTPKSTISRWRREDGRETKTGRKEPK